MRRPVDAHCRSRSAGKLPGPREDVIESGRAPRNQVLPILQALVGFLGITPNTPNTRVRAIEGLKRSGDRPLLPLTVAAPSSIARVPPNPGRHAGGPVR
jgi:hypothetical protein